MISIDKKGNTTYIIGGLAKTNYKKCAKITSEMSQFLFKNLPENKRGG